LDANQDVGRLHPVNNQSFTKFGYEKHVKRKKRYDPNYGQRQGNPKTLRVMEIPRFLYIFMKQRLFALALKKETKFLAL
jgi:hypothetical protein